MYNNCYLKSYLWSGSTK